VVGALQFHLLKLSFFVGFDVRALTGERPLALCK
jgi:hypothetical protein